MPEFAWRAVDAAGRVSLGRIEAPTAQQAMARLTSQGLVPLAVNEAGAEPLAPAVPQRAPAARLPWRRGDKVRRGDVLALTNELAIMLRAGLPLAEALRMQIQMSYRPAVRTLLQAVLDDVKGGMTLSRALARHEDVFSPFYISLIRAGEASGQLALAAERLGQYLARMAAMRESVISSATYPAILVFVSVLSLIGMMGFVVPQFEKLFADMGDAVPLATRTIVGLSHFLRHWGIELMLAVTLVGWWTARWLGTPEGRLRMQKGLLRLPLFGPLVQEFQIAIFSRTLGTLAGSGVPLLGALDIAVSTVSSQPVRQALAGMLAPVKSGGRLATAMEQTRQFGPLAVNLVRLGEETGRLGPMLLELADVTDRHTESSVRRLLTLLEPALIILLGGLIATIIVSILLGILSVNELAV